LALQLLEKKKFVRRWRYAALAENTRDRVPAVLASAGTEL